MAITTLDGVIAGAKVPVNFYKITGTMEAAFVMSSLLYASGFPGAGIAPTSAIAGDALTTYAGQLPFTNPGAGNSHLMRFVAGANVTGSLILYDRLWHNAGITESTTTGQTVTSATWPARDNNGSTNGEGVLVGIEVSTATTNGSAVTNTTLTYTNQAGTGSRTATMASFPATAVAGTFVPFQLQAGDTGVRSIQTLTLGTSYAPSGSPEIHLVAYRPIATIDQLGAGLSQALDAVQCGFPRLYDNTVPCLLWLPSATTTTNIMGQFVYTQG